MGVHFPAALAGHCRGSIIISGRFHRIPPHHGQYSHGYLSHGVSWLVLSGSPADRICVWHTNMKLSKCS